MSGIKRNSSLISSGFDTEEKDYSEKKLKRVERESLIQENQELQRIIFHLRTRMNSYKRDLMESDNENRSMTLKMQEARYILDGMEKRLEAVKIDRKKMLKSLKYARGIIAASTLSDYVCDDMRSLILSYLICEY